MLTLLATNHDVGEILPPPPPQFVQEQTQNRRCMLFIPENLCFLSWQGITIRGIGDKSDSNFHQLLLLRSADNPKLAQLLDKKKDKYTSPEIQKEVLKVMAMSLSRSIAETVRSCKFFALMADEVADVSNKERVVAWLRYVDNDFTAHDEFVGIHQAASTQSDVLVAVLRDILLILNLPLTSCRSQCYDGASNMAGVRNGMAVQLLKDEPRAVLTHCYGHALNLAASDMVKCNKILANAPDITMEIRSC